MNLTNNTIQEKKLAVIRKQITDLEQKMKERSGILEQIQVLHAAEQIERENRVLVGVQLRCTLFSNGTFLLFLFRLVPK